MIRFSACILRMATGNSPQSVQSLGQSDERRMRLIYLTRRTCDWLSRDLITHVLKLQNKGSFQGWLSKIDPKDWHRNLKIHFGTKAPALNECDTTVLTSIVQEKLDPKKYFKNWIDAIRNFRNSVSHFGLEQNFPDSDYQNQLTIVVQFLKNVDRTIFPVYQTYIDFINQNKYQTLEHFCTNNPKEIVAILKFFEPELNKIAQQIPCMKKTMDKYGIKIDEHDKKLSQIDADLDLHEKKLEQHEKNFDQSKSKNNEYDNKLNQIDGKLDDYQNNNEKQVNRLDQHKQKLEHHDEKFVSHDQKLDQYDSKIHQHEKTFDQYGDKMKEQQQKFQQQENKIASLGDETHQQSKQLDLHDKKLERNDDKLNEHDSKLSEQEKLFDQQGKTIDNHSQKFYQNEIKLDNHQTNISEHDEKLDQHDAKIDQTDDRLDQQDKTLNEHNNKLDQHGNKIEEQGKFLGQAEVKLDEHGNLLSQHKNVLDQHETKICNHDDTLSSVTKTLETIELETGSLTKGIFGSHLGLFGRENDLETLKERFTHSQAVVITGSPGLGKTTLALCYITNCLSYPKLVIETSFQGFAPGPTKAKDEIVRHIGSSYPEITEKLQNSENPLVDFKKWIIEKIYECEKNFAMCLFLEDLDDLVVANLSRDLLDIIKELVSADKRVQVICTAKDTSLSPELNAFENIDLNPLSEETIIEWCRLQKPEINGALVQELSKCSGGIPLVHKIIHKYLERNSKIHPMDLQAIIESRNSEKLTATLDFIFCKLTEHQILALQCASLFQRKFKKQEFLALYEKRCQSGANGFMALQECRGLHLIEFHDNIVTINRGYHTRFSVGYFLRPFILEYVEERFSNKLKQKSAKAEHALSLFLQLVKTSSDKKVPNINLEEWNFFFDIADSKEDSEQFVILICTAIRDYTISPKNLLLSLSSIFKLQSIMREKFSGHLVPCLMKSLIMEEWWLHSAAVVASIPEEHRKAEDIAVANEMLEKASPEEQPEDCLLIRSLIEIDRPFSMCFD